MISGRTF